MFRKPSNLVVALFLVTSFKLLNSTASAQSVNVDAARKEGKVVIYGTVVPQERELHHYTRRDDYGEMVQEGIALSNSILSAVTTSPVVYAGAVKFTQLRLFVEIVNWYIVSGSRKRLGHAPRSDQPLKT